MKGLTLIELMASMAILAIILTIGVPAMNNLIESHHAKVSLSTLRSALMSARTLALSNSQETIICPIKHNTCMNNWSRPLVVFSDINRNLSIDPDETIHLKVNNDTHRGYWQKKKDTLNFIKFTPQGHAFSSATTFLYCPYSGNEIHAKQLVISFQGRIRTNSYLSRLGTPYAAVTPLSCQ